MGVQSFNFVFFSLKQGIHSFKFCIKKFLTRRKVADMLQFKRGGQLLPWPTPATMPLTEAHGERNLSSTVISKPLIPCYLGRAHPSKSLINILRYANKQIDRQTDTGESITFFRWHISMPPSAKLCWPLSLLLLLLYYYYYITYCYCNNYGNWGC